MAATSRIAEDKIRARIAVAFPYREHAPPHEQASHQALARKLARSLGLDFVQDYQPAAPSTAGGIYYVPSHTLVREAAEAYVDDIRNEDDLFGGVVPYGFVSTKAITHSLLHPDSPAPEGWSDTFTREASSAVLTGTTVFTMRDAQLAGIRLLALGPVRIKPVRASGGRGQFLVTDPRGLDEALALQDESEIARWGLVLEEHLQEVETYSVGQVRAGGITLSYVGSQSLTPDNNAQTVYGGSNLTCVRGGYDGLLSLPLNEAMSEALRLARLYDIAVQRCYPELLASRRNYDVARGKDARGRMKTGVLEQSWRAGGASFAEACALQAFLESPQLVVVNAYTHERYGQGHQVPRNAELIYQGDDPETGFITKYGAKEPYGYTQ